MILTLEEAKLKLRVDFEDDDSLIENLILSIPDYLETITGARWDKDPINPLVKILAGFLIKKWYDNTDEFNDIIENLLITLTPMARKETVYEN